MDNSNFNRRQTIRVGASLAYAQVGVIGFDGPMDLQSLRLYGLPEAAPAVQAEPITTAIHARFWLKNTWAKALVLRYVSRTITSVDVSVIAPKRR